MKYWKCPQCKRERVFIGYLICKICPGCQCEMEVVENGNQII